MRRMLTVALLGLPLAALPCNDQARSRRPTRSRSGNAC
jgi:hypothetical protein